MSFFRKVSTTFAIATLAPTAIALTSLKAQAITVFDGVFSSTIPNCLPGQICQGLGTNSYSFGEPAATPFNTAITFNTSTFSDRPTGEFLIGTLTIRNGSIFGDTYPGTLNGDVYNTIVNLDLTEITDGNIGTSDTLKIAYGSTTNFNPNPRAVQNADILYFPDFPELGQVNILEGDTEELGTYNVGILAKFGSITPVGFQVIPNQSNGSISAIGPTTIDPITGEVVVTAQVPTPALLPGLIGMGMVRLRSALKRKKAQKMVKA